LATGPEGDPWDDETLIWLGQSKYINISVTHIERKFGSGESAFGLQSQLGQPEMTVTGFLKNAPQHAEVEITFDSNLTQFGQAILTHYIGLPHPMGQVNLPYIQMILRDSDNEFQAGLIEAMRDTLSTEQAIADARVWVGFRDGWDNSDPRSRVSFSLAGSLTWSFLHSPKLAKWAFPGGGEAGLASYPDLLMLRASPEED